MNKQYIHITKEGVQMPIHSMENSHLQNTIKLWLRKLQLAKDVLENKWSAFDKAMYSSNEDATDSATNFIDFFNANFGRYIVEAGIRGIKLDDYFTELKTILGRDKEVTDFFGKLIRTRIREIKADYDSTFDDNGQE
jgi:hypothetical protein